MGDQQEKKSALGEVVRAALDVVPEASKKIAGQNLGAIATNVTEAVAEATSWLRWLVTGPKELGKSLGRVLKRRRSLPPKDRAEPSPTLLLDAATSYASAEQEVREWWDQLLYSSVEVEGAKALHPGFSGSLKQMTSTEVKTLNLFPTATGKPYSGYADLIQSAGLGASEKSLAVAIGNLKRLGILTTRYTSRVPGGRENVEPPPAFFALVVDLGIEGIQEGRFKPVYYRPLVGVLEMTDYGIAFYEACTGRKWPDQPSLEEVREAAAGA